MQRLTNAAPGLLPGMGINPMGSTARPSPAPGAMPNNAYNMQNLMSQVHSYILTFFVEVLSSGGCLLKAAVFIVYYTLQILLLAAL